MSGRFLPRRRKSLRRGAALVELAICLPLVVVITMGTIETCTMLYLKQSLKVAAFEGCRVGLIPSATSVNVSSQAGDILNSREVRNYTVTMSPPDPTGLRTGDILTVTVSANANANSVLRGWFFSGKTLRESVSLIKDN